MSMAISLPSHSNNQYQTPHCPRPVLQLFPILMGASATGQGVVVLGCFPWLQPPYDCPTPPLISWNCFDPLKGKVNSVLPSSVPIQFTRGGALRHRIDREDCGGTL